MTTPSLDPDLTRPSQNGVYFVGDTDLDRLADVATGEALRVCRIELADCRDKPALLHQLASALHVPEGFGDDWDALADDLRDLAWLPEWGHVLLFAHAEALYHAAAPELDVLLGILDDAATFAQDVDRPFFAFLALPSSEHA